MKLYAYSRNDFYLFWYLSIYILTAIYDEYIKLGNCSFSKLMCTSVTRTSHVRTTYDIQLNKVATDTTPAKVKKF